MLLLNTVAKYWLLSKPQAYATSVMLVVFWSLSSAAAAWRRQWVRYSIGVMFVICLQ